MLSTTPASPTSVVTPFPRSFFPELHGQIVQCLPHDDLQSYSLASRTFNEEANRVLWRAVIVSPDKTLCAIEAFAQALRRDPVRAINIRRIGFIPEIPRRQVPEPLTIFPWKCTEQFWASLEEALRLVTRARSIALRGGTFTRGRSGFPDRFTDTIMDVFMASRIESLHAYLRSNRLFQICQAWPFLTTLSAGKPDNDTFVDLPPDVLPRLRHLETDIHLMPYIVPGRPIETLYHLREGADDGADQLRVLISVIRSCKTLQRVRVYCYASNEIDLYKLLQMFAHQTLQNFHLRVDLTKAMAYRSLRVVRLTPLLVILVLHPGALALFPKLEVLQIILAHPSFEGPVRGSNETERRVVADALASFLTSEGHATLRRVNIDCSFWHATDGTWGALRFLATRHDSHWEVKIVTSCGSESSSIMVQFDDIPAGYR